MANKQRLGQPLSPLQQQTWDLHQAEPKLSYIEMAERLTETSGRPVTILAINTALKRARVRLGKDASPLENRKPNKMRERRVLKEFNREILVRNYFDIALRMTESILRMSDEEIDALPVKDRAVTGAICTDKPLLLTQQPTVIIQHQDSGRLEELLFGTMAEAKRRGYEIDITPKTEEVEVEYRALGDGS